CRRRHRRLPRQAPAGLARPLRHTVDHESYPHNYLRDAIFGKARQARARRGARSHRLGDRVRRRELMLLLVGGAMAAAPTLRAQQKAMPVIGYLSGASPGPSAPTVAAFRQGLSESGYVEGQNVAIEYHWAEGRYDRLPAL